MSYTLIERKTLESSASNITFDNIPQFYSDLVILTSVRGDNANAQGLRIYFNGLTSNLSSIFLFGDGSGVSQGTGTDGFAGSLFGTGATANTFGNGMIYIPNYAGSTNKSFTSDNVTENNATTSFQSIGVGRWASTAPITSFTVFGRTDGGGTNNLIAGSSISLYGINRQQAIGAPKAVGGAISFANGYWVHSFTGSGTFYTTEDLTIDGLVIAGGGGGGSQSAGGGGAGGFRTIENQKILAGSYPVSIGTGGAGSIVNTLKGSSGSSSSFFTISSSGGGGGASRNAFTGISGGSGGGAASGSSNNGGAGNLGGFSPVEGFAGGNASGDNPPYGGAGGGGASAAGSNNQSSGGNHTGGAGRVWIDGVTRAGGGGGGLNNGTPPLGGAGGGGTGGLAEPLVPATNGSINTGSGGGGSGYGAGSPGGNGGSGIVIIRYKA